MQKSAEGGRVSEMHMVPGGRGLTLGTGPIEGFSAELGAATDVRV